MTALAALLDTLADSLADDDTDLDPLPWRRLRWRKRAACRDMDPAEFFPSKGVNPRRALAACMTCPVRIDCLEWAVEMRERQGVFGGTTEKKRRPLIRALEAGATLAELDLPKANYGCGCDICRADGEYVLRMLAG